MSFVPSLIPIAQTTLSGTALTISFSSIPTTYQHLVLVVDGRSDAAGVATVNLLVRFNSDSGANYNWTDLYPTATNNSTGDMTMAATSMQVGTLCAATAVAARSTLAYLRIPQYKNTSFHHNVVGVAYSNSSNTAATNNARFLGGTWLATTAISTITLSLSAGNFAANTIAHLYGCM